MTNYKINYGNGISEIVEVQDLETAKEVAVDGMSYTQCSVAITLNDKEVAVSQWYGVEPSDDDVVLEQFGDWGFYSDWIDL